MPQKGNMACDSIETPLESTVFYFIR